MSHYAAPMVTNLPSKPRSHGYTTVRRVLWGLLILFVALGAYIFVVFPVLSRWGATNAETQLVLPGDELVSKPVLVTTKAITIQAPPDAVWPWLIQLGVDRGGMYSYLWVENWLLRLNVVNTHEINPAWQSLEAGDFIRFTPVDYALNPGPGLYVISIDPTHSLVGCFGMETIQPSCDESSTWQFILRPLEGGKTRLILRSNTSGSADFISTTGAKLAHGLQFYMERKMLLTIRDLSE